MSGTISALYIRNRHSFIHLPRGVLKLELISRAIRFEYAQRSKATSLIQLYPLLHKQSQVNVSIQQINSDPVGLFGNHVSSYCSAISQATVVSWVVDIGSLSSPLGWGREKWRFAHCLKAWPRCSKFHFCSHSTGKNKVRLVKAMPSYVLFL